MKCLVLSMIKEPPKDPDKWFDLEGRRTRENRK